MAKKAPINSETVTETETPTETPNVETPIVLSPPASDAPPVRREASSNVAPAIDLSGVETAIKTGLKEIETNLHAKIDAKFKLPVEAPPASKTDSLDSWVGSLNEMLGV